MTLIEQLKWAAEVHGAAWAAQWAKKKGVNIDDVLTAIGAPRVGARVAVPAAVSSRSNQGSGK